MSLLDEKTVDGLMKEIFVKPCSTSGDRPLVSVVTVVYNSVGLGKKKQFLQCLDSVQDQIRVHLEHLIIDGGSRDGTVELIRGYRNGRVMMRLLSKRDDGIYDAMNRGLALARGKYVVFLNSDDYYHDPEGLAVSAETLERTGAGFSFAPAVILGAVAGMPALSPNCAPDVRRIFTEMVFSHQAVLAKRDVLLSLGGFDRSYRVAADYDLVLRMVFAGVKAAVVRKSFVTFRLGGYSFRNSDASTREVGMIYSRLYTAYSGVAVSDDEGRRMFEDKILSPFLRQRLKPYMETVFSDCMGTGYIREITPSCGLVREVVSFRRTLRPFKSGGRTRERIAGGLKMAVRHPVWCMVYIWLYKRTAGLVEPSMRARAAYNELAGSILSSGGLLKLLTVSIRKGSQC